jgi:streptomycin 6-kinase
MFTTYLRRWDLVPDGDPIVTNTGHLLPVRQRGQPAMLKLTTDEDVSPGG